ncbi:hypothetical protein ABBQ32_010273 [Trebouxia sp. C0010 RCD-2024]
MGASAVSTDDSGASVTTADIYPEADLLRLQNAVRVLLSGVGEDISREGLRDTPKRVAKAWVDVSSGYRQDLHSVLGGAVFHEPIVSDGSGSMVIVRDIEFASTSEADLLPFYGRCHVAYVPSNGVVLGLSKLARVAKLFARRLQSQQRLTSQILVGLQQELAPKGAAIVMEARHLAHGPEADFFMSSASSGCFQDNASSCMQEFLCMLQLHGIPVPSTALPRVPRDSSSLYSPVLSPCSSAGVHANGTNTDDHAKHKSNVRFMSSMGSRRIFARNGASGTVASVHQFQLEDTATTMEADDDAMQSTAQDMEAAVHVILQEIGEDPERPELQGTPQRYVQLLLASTCGAKSKPQPDFHHQLLHASPGASLQASSSSDINMAVPRSSDARVSEVQEWHVLFSSQCEHHMLPFHGAAHIAVLHSSESQQLSDKQVKSLVLRFSHRLQIQERLTNQLADAVQVVSGAAGCIVTCEAAHMCMVARGVEKHASSTITLASRGVAATDADLRGKLLVQLSQRRTPS